jgi:two-component sensor histidine kinase
LPVRDESGSVIEWLGTSTDIHDLRELQQRQQVLVAELQHRTRNLMGVVRSMSEKTARASVDLPDFRARFRDRLAALSRVQGLLSRLNDHDRVTFDELIDAELTALNGTAERVRLRGPAGVRLRSSTVQTLALALHELATNAAKYGALGQPEGLLEIAWSVEPNGAGNTPWLHIDWRESQVVMPAPRAKGTGSGQGRELIERALPYQLSAKTSFELGPDGVHCTISLPVSASAGVEEEEPANV